MMVTAPLVIESLSKCYADRPIFEDLTLTVGAGEVVVLRGPNGAGKSTLLGCIAGTVIADRGTIHIDGHDLVTAPLAARRPLRYLPQEPEVPPGLSGHELLEFFAEVFGDRAGVKRAGDWLDFGDALDRFATTYSVGMRRRLMFAALLVGRRRLLVLDEPFAGVDTEGRSTMCAAIQSALAEGAGVLIAAHDRDLPDIEALNPRPFDVARSIDPAAARRAPVGSKTK